MASNLESALAADYLLIINNRPKIITENKVFMEIKLSRIYAVRYSSWLLVVMVEIK